ncbi:MAG: 4a-hydroxytetrahydrobiopterin dehydratase [Acidobacteriota bacterium]
MKLPMSEVETRLADLPGWSVKNHALVRTLEFPSFPDAIAFVTRLAFDAQQNDHHPDLTVSYRKVTVTWSTHSDGGITAKDIDGAHTTDAVAKAFRAASPKS